MADRGRRGAQVGKRTGGAVRKGAAGTKRVLAATPPRREKGAATATRDASRREKGARSERRAGRTKDAPSASAREKRKAAPQAAEPKRLMRIKELDPLVTCGRGTTVTQLYRVDRLGPDPTITHLVFFDRHGWYCEHGRECPAVAAVRKHERRTLLTR